MTKNIVLSKKETWRIWVLEEIYTWTTWEAVWAEKMWISVRQTRRLMRIYEKEWVWWLAHKLRWKKSNHHTSYNSEQVKEIVSSELFAWFRPTYASEKLESLYGIEISKESLRQLMMRWWLWIKNQKQDVVYRMKRPRMKRYGVMIQFDGSYHDWLETWEEWCLLVAIDDATGQLVEVELCKNEWFECVSRFWMRYIQKHGVPEKLYIDRFSTYKVNHAKAVYEKEMKTHFGRAMQEVWCEVIFAGSPQAKGRVERSNQTLQDRLVKDLRIAGIKDIVKANKYIRDIYIPEHNKKYGDKAEERWDSHHKTEKNLVWVFSRRWKRVVANDMCIQYKNQYYQIVNSGRFIRPKMQVEIWENIEWEIRFQVREKEIEYEEIWHHEVKISRAKRWNELRKAREKVQKERAEITSANRHTASKKRQTEYRAKKLLQHKLL